VENKKDNRKGLYLIIILLVLSVYSYASYQENLDIQAQKQIKPEIPSDLKHLEKELPLEVQNCKDVFHSSEAKPASQRDTCYYRLAMEFKNPKICLEIEPNRYIGDCYWGLRLRL
jgi:sensor domain CHASE-containing protein